MIHFPILNIWYFFYVLLMVNEICKSLYPVFIFIVHTVPLHANLGLYKEGHICFFSWVSCFDVLVETFPKITACCSNAEMIQKWCHAVWAWQDIYPDRGGKKKEKGQVWCQQLFLVNCSFVMIKKAIEGEKESWKYTQLVLAFKIKRRAFRWNVTSVTPLDSSITVCPSRPLSQCRGRMTNTETIDNRQGWANPCCVEFQTFRWGVVPERADWWALT